MEAGSAQHAMAEGPEGPTYARPGDMISRLRSFTSKNTISRKITVRMVMLAAVPLIALGLLTITSLFSLANRADDRSTPGQTQDGDPAPPAAITLATGRADTARQLLSAASTFVDERLGDTIDWSSDEAIIAASSAEYEQVAEIADWPTSLIESRFTADELLDDAGLASALLSRLSRGHPTFTNLLLTDRNALTIGAAGSPDRFSHREQAWWQQAWSNGAYVGAIEVDATTSRPQMILAVRVDDAAGVPLGVLRAIADAAQLQSLADDAAAGADEVDVRIMGPDGRLVADTTVGHDAAQMATPVPFTDGYGLAHQEALSNGERTGTIVLDELIGGYQRTAPTRRIDRLGLEIVNHDWTVFVEGISPTALAATSAAQADTNSDLADDLQQTARRLTFIIVALILATIVLATLVSRLLAHRIAEPINRLRHEADRLADYELPELVHTLRSSSKASELPLIEPIRMDDEDGEVAELAAAFNSVRATAVDLAASQVIGRNRDVAEILLNLGRRNQQLIGRQIRFIDDLEQVESDPDTLQHLFTLDQMATRMRRNAESLLVLAGEDSPRRGSVVRPVDEVLRAAIGEVEDFARVSIGQVEPVEVKPVVISDLTHLLAELVENATNFSPPDSDVKIVGTGDAEHAYTISIVDRGVGMSPERMREANARIVDQSFSAGGSGPFLGLFVVGRLAARHGIEVRLVESMPPGVRADIILPPACLVGLPASADSPPPAQVAGTAHPPSAPVAPTLPIAPAEPSVAASAGLIDPSTEDESAGLPIPPFKTRASKLGESEDDDGQDDESSFPQQDRFQVRRRIRRQPFTGVSGPLEPTAASADDRLSGEERAAEVREKLSRFASGVLAARSNGSDADADADPEVDGSTSAPAPAPAPNVAADMTSVTTPDMTSDVTPTGETVAVAAGETSGPLDESEEKD